MSHSGEPLLRVTNLVKRFGGFRALDGVSFHLAAGEVIGHYGPRPQSSLKALAEAKGLATGI